MTNFYITTPIYYVNDIPHIGHAYTTMACDTMARYKRMAGDNVFFLTGTDEHGQKVEKAAQAANKDPQDFVDGVAQSFIDLLPTLNVTNDDFIRTTEERHKQGVQTFWQKMLDNQSIYLGEYSGWYALRDEAFYDESELILSDDGQKKAKITGAPVEWVTEKSYFFKLSEYQDKLLEYFENNPDFIAPQSRRNEVISFVKGGLKDLSISRTSFSWGVKVPNDPSHVIYVWVDALTNYINALNYSSQDYSNQGNCQGGVENQTDQKMQDFWPNAVHVVGKDILRFHAVYWPAFLMAADLPLPKKIFAHGWWTNEGQKISKSLGNTIDPVNLIKSFGDEKLGADAVRYFLLREVPFGQDGDFSMENLINRYNSDLANAYGNLVQRVLSFIYKNADAKVPEFAELTKEDEEMLGAVAKVLPQLEKHMNDLAFHRYAENLWQIISQANHYVDEQKPWSLKATDPKRMHTILYVLAETIRQAAILTQPILPHASSKILDLLAIGNEDRLLQSLNSRLEPGNTLPEPSGVFPRKS